MYLKGIRRVRYGSVVLFLITIVFLCSCGGVQQRTPTPGGPTPTPKPVSDLEFATIRQTRKDAIRLADWQKEYRDKWIGLRVRWTGYVVHVVEPEKADEQPELRIGMDPPGQLFRNYDVSFRIPREMSSQFKKDQQITFEGDIQSIEELTAAVDLILVVKLENVVVLE